MRSPSQGPPPTGDDTPREVDPHAGEVDVTLLWHNLSLSPAQRLEQHDRARESMLLIRAAGLKRHGLDTESAPAPE